MLELGADIIKTDKTFVYAMGSDRNSTTILESLADLAHARGPGGRRVENFEDTCAVVQAIDPL